MTELDDIRSFVEVVEAGGFGRAAQRLGVSKSIVSRRVARLEVALGTRLISRTTRGIAPTEAGLEFKAGAERALAELELARESVAQHGGEVTGRLRVAAPRSLVFHVAPVLAELARRHPKLAIDAAYSDRVVDLVAEGFDVALRIGQLKDSSLVARRIAAIYAVAVASPAYLAARGRPKTPADLTRHDCIVYTGATVSDWRFRAGKRWIAVRPQGRLRADSGEALIEMAKAALGVASVPTFLVSEAIRAGALEPLLLDYPMPERGLYAVRPPGAHVPAKVRVLIDALVDRFGGVPDWDPCRMPARAAESTTAEAAPAR